MRGGDVIVSSCVSSRADVLGGDAAPQGNVLRQARLLQRPAVTDGPPRPFPLCGLRPPPPRFWISSPHLTPPPPVRVSVSFVRETERILAVTSVTDGRRSDFFLQYVETSAWKKTPETFQRRRRVIGPGRG